MIDPRKENERMAKLVWSVPIALTFFSAALFAEVQVGDPAPSFSLPSTIGDKVDLKDYLGKKNVVLEFYVLDFTPG
jgi:hypothetical protein